MNKFLFDAHPVLRFVFFILLAGVFFIVLDFSCLFLSSYLASKDFLFLLITFVIVGGIFFYIGIVVAGLITGVIDWLIKLYPFGNSAGVFAGFAVLNGLSMLYTLVAMVISKPSSNYIYSAIWCAAILGLLTYAFIKNADNEQEVKSG